MDTDKVIQDLNRRFAAPLPEFYKRRIIFWYDEDREFEDKLEDIEIADAKQGVHFGETGAALPLADGLAGDVQLLSQLFLSDASLGADELQVVRESHGENLLCV